MWHCPVSSDSIYGYVHRINACQGRSLPVPYSTCREFGADVVGKHIIRYRESLKQSVIYHGIRTTTSPTIQNNTIRNNADYAIQINIDSSPSISGNTISGNLWNAIIVTGVGLYKRWLPGTQP